MEKGILFFIASMFFATNGWAVGEITIEHVVANAITPDKYEVTAKVANHSDETREVVFLAQIAFFDRTVPIGDLPVAVIRKEVREILEPWESKRMNVDLLNEGSELKGALRLEPRFRVKRQKEWIYNDKRHFVDPKSIR